MKYKMNAGWRYAVLCLLAVLFLIGCGKSIRQQADELLELGYRYMEEEKYEEAIVAFREAIAIDEKCTEAYTAAAEAYVKLAETCAEAENYDEAITYLQEGLDLTDDETVRQKLLYYRPELSAEEFLLLEDLYVLLEENNAEAFVKYLSNHNMAFQELFHSRLSDEKYLFNGTDIRMFSEGTGMVIGVGRFGSCSVFYGSFTNGKPDGTVLNIYSDMSDGTVAREGYAVGEWENGQMEGPRHEEHTELTGPEGYPFMIIFDGIFTHNVMDGTETHVLTNSDGEHRFSFQVVNGRISSEGAQYDENMGGYYIEAECEICDSYTSSVKPGEMLYSEDMNPWISLFGNEG